MKATVTTTRKTKVDLKKMFKSIRSSHVKAGVLGRAGAHGDGKLTNAQLASIHEFGLGRVPARPFIAPPFLEKKAEHLAAIRKAHKEFLRTGNPDVFLMALELEGQKIVANQRAYVTAGPGIPPPLAPATIARKGSSRPLVDTGQMIRSLDYVVIRGGK